MGRFYPAALCATVTADTTAQLRARRDAVSQAADLIELRLDTVADPDVAAALAGRSRPVIVTCRAAWEGGAFRGSEDERLAILEALRVNNWVQKDAARFLGISSRVMNYKVAKYEIKNPRWSKNKAVS